ncbi:hypothetical protein ACO1O0_003149 [Amphichorda felina]
MALWPFRRKSGRKRTRSGAALSDAEAPIPRNQTEGVIARADSLKKQRTEPFKLHRRARAYSFSPGRQDELGDERRRQSRDRAGPSTRRRDDDQGPLELGWERTPTLHHKQSGGRSSRHKSSRRKKEDRIRAAEIKAMSTFEPVRPATDAWTAGRPMKKDSRRFRTATGFGAQPASEVSLPIHGSIHSSLSSDSDYGAFRVSAFDSLAPRPTLRYAPGSRWTPMHSATTQAASQKRPLAEREPIAEETLKEHRRIDNLADDLDASDLRELMEREDRRREQRRQREQERAKRRLARQAEKHEAEREEARKSGTPPPENLERGVAGRELVGLGIDPASAVVTTTEEGASGVSEPMPDAEDAKDTDNEQSTKATHQSQADTGPRPSEEPAGAEGSTIAEEPAEIKPQDSTTSLARSSRLAGILRSKKSRSKSSLVSEREKAISPAPDVIDEEGAPRHSSWDSDKRGRFSLTSFIRRGGKNRHSSGGPGGAPSFSNTSREEMQAGAAQTPAQAQALALARLQGEDVSSSPEPHSGVYISRKPSASATLRMKSRFREDLPDFPMSPPDSRLQSPETESPSMAPDEQNAHEGRTQPIAIPAPNHNASYGRTPNTMTPEPLSMSLASIDSEGSWLSGRVSARQSAIRDSIVRANRLEQNQASASPTNSTQEDLGITDDDYLARFATHRNSGIPRLSEDGRPSSDEEDFTGDSGARWGAVGARPQMVHVHRHDRDTMQSQVGLLNIESGDEEGSDSPVTSSAQETADVRRARSVNIGRGGHVRNFSAGSAKLLDLTPRSSVDMKGKNSERRASGRLA